MVKDGWEPIIGIEIHAELNTATKLFSSDANLFGQEPNVNISEVSVGLPGALPVLNREAVRKAIRFGLAIKGEVQLWSRFDRKSYFYPDCPRNFQITQYDFPIVKGGIVTALVQGEEKQFAVNRVQLEDDSGMLKHFTTFAGVDFNRAGVPLIEIVSEACMRSAADAVAYAQAIRAILDYTDVSDCNMEEGSLRFDVNVSVRRVGELVFRNRIEIKNLNSFMYLEQAISHEIERQIALYEKFPDKDPWEVVQQSTRRWDQGREETVLMRSKEDAQDYRYFPDPDLLPLVLSRSDVERERGLLPELPLEKERRFVREFGLSAQQSFFLAGEKKLADYFEEAVRVCAQPKLVASWVLVEFGGRFKEKGIDLWKSGITSAHVAELVQMISQGEITSKIAKSVADDMVVAPGKSPRHIVNENASYKPFSDMEKLREIIEEVVKNNEQSVKDFKQGRDRAFAFLVGQVMKKTQGAAPPDQVNRMLKERMS